MCDGFLSSTTSTPLSSLLPLPPDGEPDCWSPRSLRATVGSELSVVTVTYGRAEAGLAPPRVAPPGPRLLFNDAYSSLSPMATALLGNGVEVGENSAFVPG